MGALGLKGCYFPLEQKDREYNEIPMKTGIKKKKNLIKSVRKAYLYLKYVLNNFLNENKGFQVKDNSLEISSKFFN